MIAQAAGSQVHPAPGTVCPADLHALAPIAWTSTTEVTAVVARARRVQAAWSSKSFAERAELLQACARRVHDRRDEGAKLLFEELGREPTDSVMTELAAIVDGARAVIREARKALLPEKIPVPKLELPGKNAHIEAVARGVVGIISPWNYPILNVTKPLLPALLAGNTVVLKPSEHTPRSSAWLASCFNDVLPPDVLLVVQGDGAVGNALIDAGVAALVFTGSVATGRRVSARCGEKMIPCSLELGGKDAAIVLADCNFERTVAGVAHWAFHNAGQDCAAIERVYVEESIADRFVERLGAVAKSLRVAPTQDGLSDLGPVQNARQLDLVELHVADARAKGAVVVTGGARTGPGLGYLPTVLDRCTEDMLVVTDETFGPVVAVLRVKDVDEAVRRANSSRFGLCGSVWTTDARRGQGVLARLEVGIGMVNNHAFTGGGMPALPWTGTKETGTGLANSHHCYDTFVRRKAILIDTNKDPDPWWSPVDENLTHFSDALIDKAAGKLSALPRLIGLVGKRVKTIRARAKGTS